jgi:hypothetical protein
MRPVLGLGACFLLFAAGCSKQATPVVKNSPAPIRFAGKVEVPDSLAPTDLGILNDGNLLRVGDSLEDANRVFPAPQDIFGLKELPPGFGSGFRARGYETPREGLGLILVDNRVAVAMRRIEDVSADTAKDAVRRYVAEFGEPSESVSGARIEYRFWSKEDQRLMVCTAPDRKEPSRYDVTVAVGVSTLMDALRMSYASAREDRAIAEKALPGLRHPG